MWPDINLHGYDRCLLISVSNIKIYNINRIRYEYISHHLKWIMNHYILVVRKRREEKTLHIIEDPSPEKKKKKERKIGKVAREKIIPYTSFNEMEGRKKEI